MQIDLNEFKNTAHPRDHRKFELLNEFDRVDCAPQSIFWTFSYSQLGVSARLNGLDPISAEAMDYLRVALGPFLTPLGQPQGKADIEIFYKTAPSVEGRVDSGLWENPEPDVWVISENNRCERPESGFELPRSFSVVQRDFSAKVGHDFTKAEVIGPEIGLASSDTLDNLNAFLFPAFLLKKDAVYLHSSAVVRNGRAHVFFGHSGAGKSTLAKQCGHIEGLKVIGTDQVILSHEGGQLFATACTRKSPEFPWGDPNFSFETYPVAGVYYLKKLGHYHYKELDFTERVSALISESDGYLPDILSRDEFLRVICKISSISGILFGEISYPKGESVWKEIDKAIEKRRKSP